MPQLRCLPVPHIQLVHPLASPLLKTLRSMSHFQPLLFQMMPWQSMPIRRRKERKKLRPEEWIEEALLQARSYGWPPWWSMPMRRRPQSWPRRCVNLRPWKTWFANSGLRGWGRPSLMTPVLAVHCTAAVARFVMDPGMRPQHTLPGTAGGQAQASMQRPDCCDDTNRPRCNADASSHLFVIQIFPYGHRVTSTVWLLYFSRKYLLASGTDCLNLK